MSVLGLTRHRALNAQLARLHTPERVKRIDEVLKRRIMHRVCLGIEDVKHPHNIAACLRTADAYGLQSIYTLGKPERLSSWISRGTNDWLTVKAETNSEAFWSFFKRNNYQIMVSDLSPGAISYQELEPTLSRDKKYVFIFGSEADGVSEEARNMADVRWYLPMYGLTKSFNVSVSVAVLLTNLDRAGLLSPGDMTDEEKELLKTRWLLKGLESPVAASILAKFGVPEETALELLKAI